MDQGQTTVPTGRKFERRVEGIYPLRPLALLRNRILRFEVRMSVMKKCEMCGNEIEPERLEVIPETVICAKCAHKTAPPKERSSDARWCGNFKESNKSRRKRFDGTK